MVAIQSPVVHMNTNAGEVRIDAGADHATVTTAEDALEITIPLALGPLGNELSMRIGRAELLAMIPKGWLR